MKLVKNEELSGCQLHNQQIISRMIMRNEWRTKAAFKLVRGYAIPFRPLSNEGKNKSTIRLSGKSSRRLNSLFTLL